MIENGPSSKNEKSGKNGGFLDMRVKDLILHHLKNKKMDHVAHRDEISEYVRSKQPQHVRKGLRTAAGVTSYLNKLRRVGVLST